jgi:hypothetical protein
MLAAEELLLADLEADTVVFATTFDASQVNSICCADVCTLHVCLLIICRLHVSS